MTTEDWTAELVVKPGEDNTETEPATSTDGEDGQADKDAAPKPMYPTVEAWVIDHLGPIITRPHKNSHCWCPEWWRHPEAISRLEALWRAWEHLRRDGTTGMSVWWRDHADQHLAFLRDTDSSPFAKCSPERGHLGAPPPLPITPAPAGWFADASPDPTLAEHSPTDVVVTA